MIVIRKIAHLNVISLRNALDVQRKRLKLSWRQAAEAMSVSPSTLARMRGYRQPNAEGLMRMLEWLGSPPLARFTLYEKRASR